MYNIDDCPNLHCIDCKFYKANAELDTQESTCKRINHKDIKFYKPWFKSYDCGRNHLICSDFEPAHPEYADIKGKWTNFDDFWAVYKDVWLTETEKRGIAFFVGNDFDVGYRVPLEKFIYGDMVRDGILQATEKFFVKQSRKSPTGYELITEKINGVQIKVREVLSVSKGKIIVEPKKLWAYYQQHKSSLGSTMFEIARNDEYGIAIYLSEDEVNEPCITVEADDTELYSEQIGADDAEKTCERIYDSYLTDKVIDSLTALIEEASADDEESLLEQQDAIEEREMELDIAVSEFISAVLGGDAYLDGEDYDDIIEDCKDHFLEYLARKHGLDIFRPMVLEDEDGEDFYEEYPYDCMEFDDEDNPIYQP